jgi:hypothetical protein
MKDLEILKENIYQFVYVNVRVDWNYGGKHPFRAWLVLRWVMGLKCVFIFFRKAMGRKV